MLTVNVLDGIALDLEKFVRFQRRAYSENRGIIGASSIQTAEYYRWKYHAPWGIAKVSTAEIDATLVSAVAAIPYPLIDRTNEQMGWQLCDIATHSTYRRQGLFRRCLSALISTLPPNSMIFCFPNRQSFVPLIRMGFVTNGALRLWVSVAPLLNRGRYSWREKPQDANLTPALSVASGAIRAHINKSYLEWRFVSRPAQKYRWVGVKGWNGNAIVRSLVLGKQPVSILMALTNCDPDAQNALLRAAVSCESARGARAMIYLDSCWSGSIAPLFIPVPSWMLPRRFPIVCKGFGNVPACFHTCDWDVL
jgi:hypothetical protein